MEAAEPLDHVLHVLLYKSDPPPEEPPESSVLRKALDDLESAMPGLYKAHLRLAITGPEGMWGYGRNVWGSVRTLRAFLEDTLSGDTTNYYTYLERQADGLEDAREMFAGAANSILMGDEAGFELGYGHGLTPSQRS
ncbi:hypothetical protein J8N05_14115 [Streptomyces sp. BH-SS-21]|uniref:Uncharacterized protein n=1 Tax=Streptomyces liliiviolaceus TaxID=2823109 RepID=A0A941B3K7_9ACTN|nr:hypothetical protein [Streptomyces liliiviolaceus]MBQ0849340.1 hypothetical protein [Streptomyces liliiviolaceus]